MIARPTANFALPFHAVEQVGDGAQAKFANALAAAAIGVLQLGVAISLAALIFQGPLSAGAGRAAAGFVLGTAIVSAIVGVRTKMSVVIAGAQDTAAIMVAAVAAAIVATPEVTTDQMLPTVVVMIAVAGLATGLLFWILGVYGLSAFVRFLPFPVISGFTAGTGWLLVRGGVEVMHGKPLEFGDVLDLLNWQQAKFIVPGLVLAGVMLIVVTTPRLPNTLVSVAILAGSIIFHIVARSVSTLDEIEAQGWLIGPFDDSSDWAPVGPSDFADTNWAVLLDNALLIAAVVAVSVIGMLLNLSGLENGPDMNIDLNAEMKSAGIANVFVGLGGGLVGYHLLGDILLGRQLGARGRTIPIAISVMAALTFLIGADVVALVPRAVAGGVLAGLGVTVLVAWARTSLPRMNRTDQLLSTFILLIIGLLGVLVGVGAGVVVAAAVFIINYSRIDPVRHIIEAAGRSTVDRDERDQAVLLNASQQVLAFELHGYLFFGSTTQLRRQVDQHVAAAPTRFVIIDFARVTGIDSTAASGLSAISTQLQTIDVTTIWSGLPATIATELIRDAVKVAESHVDLDHAIAWCEDQVIETAHGDDLTYDGHAIEPFDDALMAVLKLPQVSLDEGETLISAGATDSDVYFLESGRLTAWLPAENGTLIRLRQVLPGAALGEIAFCTGAARTATVIADSQAVIRVLKRERFDELAITDPEAAIAVQHELLRRLSKRVTSTSAMVRDLLK